MRWGRKEKPPDFYLMRFGNIHPGVCVGSNPVLSEGGLVKNNVPTIDDFVYLGPGAKLFGDIVVGDCVMVGANAVVNQNVDSDRIVFGNPLTLKENHHKIATTASRDFEQLFVALYPQFEKYLK
ncbi:MAG: hypothetical protein J6T56_04175 [Bacteroidales bacterium]|nr:hypothetical protein [Bacteroidales bacterium]